MPIQTDVLQTIFAVKGLSSLISAFNADAAAQQRMVGIQSRLDQQSALGAVSIALHNEMLHETANAAQAATNAQIAFLTVIGGAAVKAIQGIVTGLHDAVQAYVEYGDQVMAIRDLTGASARESAQAAELFRVAGVKDTQAIREYLKVAKDLTSGQGRMGLSQLGISPASGENTVHLFTRIIDQLGKMPAGMQRTLAMEELFGARGAAALAPLLRMTQQQREAALGLGDAFDTTALAGIQAFQNGVAYLGQAILVQLVYPLANALLPVLNLAISGFTKFSNLLKSIPSWVVGVAALAGAFAGIGGAIAGIMLVVPPLIAALRSIAVVEAIIDALAGQWQNLFAGAVAGAAAGIGIYGIGQLTGGDASNENTSAVNANTSSNLRVAGAMDKFTDSWQEFNRGGIPRGLQRGDVAELNRLARLSAIG